jgi:hypothetical protein
VSPDIPDATKARLSEIEPVATTVCSTATDIGDIKKMSESVFAVVTEVVKESTSMTPEQKEGVIIAITTARLMIASYKVPQ